MAAILAVALLLSFAAIRVAWVEAYAAKKPSKAALLWSGHPSVLLELGLAQIGAIAAAGRPIDKSQIDRLVAVSTRAPLSPEPFLVRGVDAQLRGDRTTALRAFLAARQRNPRAVAARYFLADLYLKADQTEPGLAEISALARLVPESLPKIAPNLAAYAQNPKAAPQVKAMLRSHPQLELALLYDLSADARNGDLIAYLWSGRTGEDARPWQGRLMQQLVETGRFDQARSAWSRFTGFTAEPGQLFDADFTGKGPPPFGWQLISGASGIAEPQGGGLHVLYYGRDDLVLASQLMTLPPGQYQLSMKLAAGAPAPKSLSWTVRCLPDGRTIAAIPLDRPGAVTAHFGVQAGGCAAQRLELNGKSPEFPERAELTISQLRLQRSDGG